MEMKLIHRTVPAWIEGEPLFKRLQLSAETVIPDSREDAQSILWTQGGLLLKGKDPTAHGCTVSGELWAGVLYLTEGGKAESLCLRKEFDMSFDTDLPDPEALPQIAWQLTGAEARLLNPRKMSVSFEVQALLRPFQKGSIPVESDLPEPKKEGLHQLLEEREALLLRQIKEKTFSLRQQLPMNQTDAAPREIVGETLRFAELSAETIGSRCIVKGEIQMEIWGSDETDMPVSASFRLPFSQLVELDEEFLGQITVHAEPCSVYLDWIDGAGGERSLDLELHGLLQMRIYDRQTCSFVRDAYSSRMPSCALKEKRTILTALERRRALLSAQESLPMPEDFQTLLSSRAKLGPLERDREQVRVPLILELLIRRKDGRLDGLRRSFRLQAGPLPEDALPIGLELTDCSLTEEQGKLSVCGEAELLWEADRRECLEEVSSLQLKEDAVWDPAALPALTLVYPGGESLWELAKEYRSSVELITDFNPEGGGVLLIPTE